ncbi:heme A synthase [Candidatus Acetothermia bacterium]|nr:heme A synthase [Candidatus Acetothermia bacterium]
MLKFLALLTTIAVFLLLLVGGVVSGTGSGLGCPDWPLCHGKLIPDFTNPEVAIEWSHRLVAALAGFLVLVSAIVAWRQGMKMLSALSLVLVIIQAGLGGLTVKLELTSPEVTTAHLAVGLGLFATMVIITALAFRASRTSQYSVIANAGFSQLLLVSTFIVYIQMLIGGYVRHTGAGLACLDFPLCNDQGNPAGVGLQLLHRMMGVVAALLIGWLAMKASKMKQPRSVIMLAHGAFGLVLVQILLGAMSVWTQLQVHVTTTHLAVAAAILALLVTLCVKTFGTRVVAATGESVSPKSEKAVA